MNRTLDSKLTWCLPRIVFNTEERQATLSRSYDEHNEGLHFYCGKKDAYICPEKICDGCCGEKNGCNCPSCKVLDAKFLKGDREPSGEISLKESHYNVKINEVGSETELIQKYKNDKAFPVEVKYKCPLPFGSSVTKYTVKVGDEVLESKLKEKEKAKNKYSDEIAKGNTPTLAEINGKEDDKVFEVTLGNVLSNMEIEIRIVFIQKLDITFSKPLSLSSISVKSNDPIYKVFTFRLPAHEKVTLEAEIESTEKIVSITSTGHILEHDIPVNNGNSFKQRVKTRHTEKDEKTPEFILNISLPWNGNSSELNVIPFTSDLTKEKTFMVNYLPMITEEFNDELETEIVFLIDVSGSMGGKKIEQVKDAMKTFINSLPSGSSFNLFKFSSNFESVFQTSLPYKEDNINNALKFIDQLEADGGTNLHEALLKCCETELPPGKARQCFVLTDGDINDLDECLITMTKNKSNNRFFGIGLGSDVSDKNMVRIANAADASYLMIKENENAEESLIGLLEKACVSSITNLKVNNNDESQRVFPKQIPTVYAGRSSLFFISSTNNMDSIIVEGISDGKSQVKKSFKIPDFMNNPPKNNLLSQLHGVYQIRELEHLKQETKNKNWKNNQEKENEISKIDKELVDLSKKYGILSTATAFITVKKNIGIDSQGSMESENINYASKNEYEKHEIFSLGMGGTRGGQMLKSMSSCAFSIRKAQVAVGSAESLFHSIDSIDSNSPQLLYASTGNSKVPMKKSKVESGWKQILEFKSVDSSISINWLKTLKTFPMHEFEEFCKNSNNATYNTLLCTYFACLWLNQYYKQDKKSFQLIEKKAIQFVEKNSNMQLLETIKKDSQILLSLSSLENNNNVMETN